MTLFGPVFYYDLVRQSRRRFIPVLRLLYLLALFSILSIGGCSWSSRYPDGQMPSGTLVEFVESFFSSFLIVQFLVVGALTPALTAGAITEEKESQTLPFVLASPLHSHEIILGKLASRLGALLLIVMAGLPVFSLLQLLGGVDPGWLWAGFMATGVTMLSLAAVSLFWSVVMPRSRDAVLFAYLTPPIYIFLSQHSLLIEHASWANFPSTPEWESPITAADLAHGFNAGDPLLVMERALMGMRGGAMIEHAVGSYALFHGVVTIFALLGAMLRLRKAGLGGDSQPRTKKAKVRSRLLYGGRPAIGNNPIVWREVYAERGSRMHWLARSFTLLLAVALFYWPLELFLSEHRYRGWASEAMNMWVRISGALVATLLLLAVGVRAAGAFSGERQKQTLDVLLTTPLTTDEVLFGKWLGCLASIGWGWAWLGAIAGLGLITGTLSLLALPLLCLCWASSATFLAVLGLRFSLRATSTLRATVRTLMTAGLLWFGPWILLSCCASMMFMRGDTIYKLMAGYTPPFALGCVAFGTKHLDRDSQGELILYALVGAVIWTVAAAVLWGVTREDFRKLAGRKFSSE